MTLIDGDLFCTLWNFVSLIIAQAAPNEIKSHLRLTVLFSMLDIISRGITPYMNPETGGYDCSKNDTEFDLCALKNDGFSPMLFVGILLASMALLQLFLYQIDKRCCVKDNNIEDNSLIPDIPEASINERKEEGDETANQDDEVTLEQVKQPSNRIQEDTVNLDKVESPRIN